MESTPTGAADRPDTTNRPDTTDRADETDRPDAADRPNVAGPPGAAIDSPSDATPEVGALRTAVEQAQFEAVNTNARALLARDTLSARERNDTLELLAIAQIAARQDGPAESTLTELFARDPEHPSRLRDPGPDVEHRFARIRAQNHPSVAVDFSISAMRDAHARVLVELQLGAGRDAVDSVHIFAAAPSAESAGRTRPAASTSELTSVPTPSLEPTHVVAEVRARSRLTLALPAISDHSSELDLYVEARAPSGYALGQLGSATAPLRVRLEPDLGPAGEIQPTPLRRTWWLWTSVAIVAAGIGITGALLAH